MRFLLLLLSLVLQLNISGFANHNPQEIHVIKTHFSQKHQLSVTIKRNGEYKVDCSFRFQGQYEDAETELYHNYHHYYDCDSESYISQDPIRLAGNNPTLCGYVKDVNSWVDVLSLTCTVAKTSVTKRWVKKLTGKNVDEIESMFNKKGFTRSLPQAGFPDKIQHTQYTRVTKAGDTIVFDITHEEEFIQMTIGKSLKMEKYYGRIGHGGFGNYDLIKDFPVFIDGILVNLK